MASRLSRPMLLMASALSLTALGASSAFAQDSDTQLGSIEKQIKALQAELHHMKAEAAVRDRELKAAQVRATTPPPATAVAPVMPQIPAGYALVPAAPGAAPGSVVLARAEAPPEKKLPNGTFQVGGVTVTLGGFIEAASIYRSRNEVTDISSSFTSGIPERNSQLYHESEFRETARQSRVQGLATAHPDEVTTLQAFVAMDFLGAAPTANSNQSNSFTPRLREGYASYARSDWGFEFLAGQTWSLMTMTKVGMEPLNVNSPLTVDASYVPGFNWARQPQFRLEKSFANNQYWLALSVENPQTTYSGTYPTTIGTINIDNTGAGVDGNGVTNQFSNNIAPDVIVKATADYNLAHLEAYAVGSVLNDRVSQLGTGQDNTTFGGGAGGAALIHVIPKMLDIQVSGLAGKGVGRYGASSLPDATISATGKPEPLPAYSALAGIIAHPIPTLDLYAYLGTDQVSARYSDAIVKGKVTAYGYGNPLFSNAGCNEELSTLTCTANTSGDVQGTVGFWYKFLKGSYGTMQYGLQYSYTKRDVFQGVGPTPKTDDNMLFFSFRYYPFS